MERGRASGVCHGHCGHLVCLAARNITINVPKRRWVQSKHSVSIIYGGRWRGEKGGLETWKPGLSAKVSQWQKAVCLFAETSSRSRRPKGRMGGFARCPPWGETWDFHLDEQLSVYELNWIPHSRGILQAEGGTLLGLKKEQNLFCLSGAPAYFLPKGPGNNK